MSPAILRRSAGAQDQPAHTYRSSLMKWETPQATELRFGMEITMYVANR
jgi:coenzyme PQQ precursor peptide PqqA